MGNYDVRVANQETAGLNPVICLHRGCYRPKKHKGPHGPQIVCLCGSSRFVAEMAVIAWEVEKEGRAIVLSLHLLPSWYTQSADHQAEVEGVSDLMDELHLRKIDFSDRILVVNINGYIGKSTRREIEYARSHGKVISYLHSYERPERES